jgi:hypothetical protein
MRNRQSFIDAKDAEPHARAQSNGAPLRVVSATKSEVIEITGGRVIFQVEEWEFTYGESGRMCPVPQVRPSFGLTWGQCAATSRTQVSVQTMDANLGH